MYCSKCGRPTENNQTLCNECLQMQNPQGSYYANNNYAAPGYNNYAPAAPVVHPGKRAFGKALTSTILSTIALIVAWILFAAVQANSAVSYYSYYYYYYWDPTPNIIGNLLVLAPAIISIIFGAKSLGESKGLTAKGMTRHVPSFILGLIGLIQGIAAALLISASLITAFQYL